MRPTTQPTAAGQSQSRPGTTSTIGAVVVAVALSLLAACGSGPTQAVLDAGRIPESTTTTEPPPEGVLVIRLTNGSIQPSNVLLDTNEHWIVEWRHDDIPERTYTLESDEFTSPELGPGDTFQFDFSGYDPRIFRYNIMLGQNRLSGFIDTRPAQ